MNILIISSSFPSSRFQIDNSKTEFEIFSTNFRIIDHEPIIRSIENENELKKAANLATVLRLTGNDHFNEGEYAMALYFYFKSTALAPVDSPEYALAVGNRSAVFFALKDYKQCLRDIEHALKVNYPESKLLKIYIRQTECFLKLKQNHDAIKAWTNATAHTDQLRNVNQAETIQNQIMDLIRTSQFFNKDIREEQCPKPELKNGENANFLNASNSVELRSNDTKGRHVVAINDFEQGDVLFAEEPYSAVVMNNCDHNITVYCNNCLIIVPTIIPCIHCAFHFYCSDECRKLAWEKSHKWECFGERKQLFSNNNRLVLKVIFKASLNNFNTIVEDDSRYGNKIDNFAFVNKLVTNKNQMTNDDIVTFTQNAIFLIVYLKNFTDYFEWLHAQPTHADKSMSDLYEYIGGIILKLSMQVYCNIDEMVDIDVLIDESPGIGITHTGCGLYVSSAMINHSCEPNALISFDQGFKVIRAVEKITKNSEITVDYKKIGDVFLLQTEENITANHYKFECICRKCSSDRRKDEDYPWRCRNCHGKAFVTANSRRAQCANAACNHCFSIRRYQTVELLIGPNLLAAPFLSDPKILDDTLKLMKKIYHKENVKYVGYYFVAYSFYFDKRDMKKCVEISRDFVNFIQFDAMKGLKVSAYLRLTTALLLYYTQKKLTAAPVEDTILPELRSSLIESKKLLALHVPPRIVKKFENHIKKFLDEFLQEPLI